MSETETVYWTEVKQITRLRLLSDRGFPMWDVSYCKGITKDGDECYVTLPFHQLPKRGMKAEIVRLAKQDGVFAKDIGILDDANISKFS